MSEPSSHRHTPQPPDLETVGPRPLTVTALLRSVRDLLERRFPLLHVHGELSNLTLARSGHWYFTLKDAESQVRCVMFRGRNQTLDWRPQDGARVEVRALATLYEARGDFQLIVESMRRYGLGDLFEAFLRLKEKLAAEGLFDPQRKRQPPDLPRRVGIITSPNAAALRDVITTMQRRNPAVPILIYPAAVQGSQAAGELARALESASRRKECDVLLLVRGGGSIEDLSSFNDERLARAIRASIIPVVVGVGHETDFTIADFAADLRAPTPTAAAELVTPSRAALLERLAESIHRVSRCTRREIERRMQALDDLQRSLADPWPLLERHKMRVAHLISRLQGAGTLRLSEERWRTRDRLQRLFAAAPNLPLLDSRLRALGRRLDALARGLIVSSERRLDKLASELALLDPMAVLARGYSIIHDDASGSVVRDAQDLSNGQLVRITLAHGRARAKILEKK